MRFISASRYRCWRKKSSLVTLAASLALFLAFANGLHSQPPTGEKAAMEEKSAPTAAEQKAKLNEIQAETKEAAKLFADGKVEEAAEKVLSVQKQLIELLGHKDPVVLREGRKAYAALQKAHERFEIEGATLDPLPAWDELVGKPVKNTKPSSTKSTTEKSGSGSSKTKKGGVSFKEDVAPWLISECGGCHVTQRKGDFSMASYAELIKGSKAGRVLFPGSAKDNPIVDLIESGAMPPSGGGVSKERLELLKRWIAEGARFDGPNPNAPVTAYTKSGNTLQAKDSKGPQKSTGRETVSFARDIAPILRENCNGCHIASRQPSGGFRMTTFNDLFRGGQSGPAIEPGKSADSLLVKKLKGEAGARMPMGGRPLSDEQIGLISKWIDEKATFDGAAFTADINRVMELSWAENADHRELFTKRQERAEANWSKVLPNDRSQSVKNDQVFMLGNVPTERLNELMALVDKAIVHVSKQLGVDADKPFIKGGLTVFVLKNRYDYSEFGKMTESRALPKEWQAHWRADTVDAYAVIADDSAMDEKQHYAQIVQVITGVYLGHLSGVPNWFAEGVARNQVILLNKRGDAKIKAWQAALPSAVQAIDKPETLLQGPVDEEIAGLVGMGITSVMMDRSNKRRFDSLMTSLRSGTDFDEACTSSFGPPANIVKNFLPKR